MPSSLFNLIPLSPELITGALLFTVATFVGTIAVIPWVLTRIPEDYFRGDKPPPSPFKISHPAASLLLGLVRNALGMVLLVMGVLMLVLPGQGILTLVVATFLLQFPRKYRIERWLVRKPAVRNSINWLRKRFDAEPLQFD